MLRSLHKKGAGFAAIVAAAVLLIAPYGCSKDGGKAPETKQQEAAAPAAGTAEAGKQHFERGVEFSLKGELDSAIREYEAALKINPKSPETHNNIGFAYLDKGELEKAVDHQKKAIELNPNLANGYFGLAMAYEKMGKKEEALKNWKEFAKLSQPHSKWWMKAQEHIQALEGKPAAAPQKK